jgi:archaellum biogenesis ATPase FlaH
LIEIVGPSAGGKTTLCLKIAIKALLDQDEDTEIIYVDSTNYVNYDNVTYILKQHLGGMDLNERDEIISKMLERFKVFNIYDVDHLIVLLATVVSQLKNNTAVSRPSLIIVDSLSSMISGIQQ